MATLIIPLIQVVSPFSNPGTGTITVQVNSAPTVTSVALYDDNSGTTTTPTTTLTPFDPMTLVVTISDSDLSNGDYISKIEVKFYYDSGTGEPATTSPDTKAIYTFTRTSNTDPGTWTIDDGLPTGTTYDPYRWTLDSTTTSFSEDTTTNQATLTLVFTPSKIAVASTTSSWTIVVNVYDSFNSAGSSTSTYTCAKYQEISLNPASLTILVPADGASYLAGTFTVSVISNYDFTLQFKADQWTGGTTPPTLTDLQLYVDDDNDFANDVSNQAKYQLTTTYGPTSGWGTYSRTTWDGTNIVSFSLSLYVFVVASTTVQPGSYTTTIYVLVG